MWSKNDFIHKMKIVLKELRETFVGLKIFQHAKLNTNEIFMTPLKAGTHLSALSQPGRQANDYPPKNNHRIERI